MGAICAWPCCEASRRWPPDAPAERWLGAARPPCTWANSPCTFMTVMLMLPVTALTPSSDAICVSLFVEMRLLAG